MTRIGPNPSPQAIAVVPPGTPEWITGHLIEATIRVWQPFYNEPVTTEVAVEMLIRVGQLFGTLCPRDAFPKEA